MPSLNLFLPALLGGFVFVLNFYPVRLWAEREQGYKLVFAASIAGGVLWFFSHLFWHLGSTSTTVSTMQTWWSSAVPIPSSLPVFTAFLVGVLAWVPLNQLARIPRFSRAAVQGFYVRRRGDSFELELLEALERQHVVAITLKSMKVYVGRVVSSLNPAHAVDSVKLRLLRSGYRDTQTHSLELDVNYEAAPHSRAHEKVVADYSQITENAFKANPDLDPYDIFLGVFGKPEDFTTQDYEVVILAREIQSVARFDLSLFDEYFGTRSKDQPTAGLSGNEANGTS